MLPVVHTQDIAKRQLTPNTRHDFQKVLPLSSPLFMQGSPPELGSVSSGHSLPLESRQRTPQHLPGSTLLPQFTPSAAPIAKASAYLSFSELRPPVLTAQSLTLRGSLRRRFGAPWRSLELCRLGLQKCSLLTGTATSRRCRQRAALARFCGNRATKLDRRQRQPRTLQGASRHVHAMPN